MAYTYPDNPRKDVLCLIPEDGKVIGSVGCGQGRLEYQLVLQGREVHGVDISQEAIDVASTRLTTARVVGPDERLPFAEESLDGLILADVIEHLPRAWDRLADYARMVKPGGWVVISVPNMLYIRAFLFIAIRGDWPEAYEGIFDRTHVQFMTIKRLRRWCQSAGLDVIQWQGADYSQPAIQRLFWWLDRLTLRLFRSRWMYSLQVCCRRRSGSRDGLAK